MRGCLRAASHSSKRWITTNSDGTNRTARQVEAIMPENTVMPIDLRALAPAPLATTSGATPIARKSNRRHEGADCYAVSANEVLGALVEHGHGAAILRPAGNIVAQRHRPFLAVGDGAHAGRRDAARDQVLAHGFGAAGAKCDVVFARAALVGMAFDGEGIAVVVVEPLRLLVERRARLTGQFRGIGIEEHAVADIDDEVLLAARRRGRSRGILVGLF